MGGAVPVLRGVAQSMELGRDVVKVLLALATDTRIRKWVPAAPVIEELRKRGLTNEPQQ